MKEEKRSGPNNFLAAIATGTNRIGGWCQGLQETKKATFIFSLKLTNYSFLLFWWPDPGSAGTQSRQVWWKRGLVGTVKNEWPTQTVYTGRGHRLTPACGDSCANKWSLVAKVMAATGEGSTLLPPLSSENTSNTQLSSENTNNTRLSSLDWKY